MADPRSSFTVDSLRSQRRHLISPLTYFRCLGFFLDEMNWGLEAPVTLRCLVEQARVRLISLLLSEEGSLRERRRKRLRDLIFELRLISKFKGCWYLWQQS